MIRAYDELVDFIAGGATPAMVASFSASQRTRDLVADLLQREKAVGLSEEDTAELEHYMHLEHVTRLAKARATGLNSK
jgi:hypothetical protein